MSRIDRSAETEDYPNLVVCDGRVTGSITINRSRLPLSTIAGLALHADWAEVVAGWDYIESDYGFTEADLAGFLWNLLDVRHEWARLICIIADVHRRPRQRKADTDRLRAALIDCLAALQPEAEALPDDTPRPTSSENT